jgi:hypothetical protein
MYFANGAITPDLNKQFTFGANITAASGFAYGTYMAITLRANANSDSLIGLALVNTWNDDGKSGVQHIGLKLDGDIVQNDGKFVIWDGAPNYPAGIVTEAGAALINFGINEGSGNRFGTYVPADQGGMLTFDTRAGHPVWSLHYRGAGSTISGKQNTSLCGDSAGNVGLAVTIFGTSATKVFAVGSGTAPTTAPADIAQIWVQDLNGAGTAGFKFMNEASATAYTLAGLASGTTGLLKGDATTGILQAATAGVDYQPAPVQINYTSADPWTPTPAVGTVGAEIRFQCASVDHALVFGTPTGTPVNGQILTIRLKSDATPRALDFATSTAYRAGTDMPLPTTTVASKTGYAQFAYNSTDTKWDLVSVMGGY